uniref:CRAL-TRIO domain-containing protein n=1 Tax=Xenopus tropicalis TaxID=8364 RepID=A0A1B8XTZ0_XENTR
MDSVDFEKLAEIELQKDEEDLEYLGPPVVSGGRKPSDVCIGHPYYDIARHGILHVVGTYMKHTLDQYVENDYTLVYFHYGLNSRNKPSLGWLQSAYKEFDRK